VKQALAAGLLAVLAANAQNWPAFRGANAAGVADGFPLATAWDAGKPADILWKTAIPGLAVSSPVIWGGRVFVSTAISSDPNVKLRHGLYGDVDPDRDVSKHSWRLYCLDKRDGRIVWERVAHEGIPRTKRHPKSSQASCTPVTDGNTVVVSFGSEGLYAYNMDGKLRWKQDLGALNAGWFFDPDYEWGVASSPIIWRGLVIVQCDIQKNSFVAAFRLADGRQVWRTPREEIPSWGTPTIYDGAPRPELITHATRFIRGYDPLSGRELWRLSGNSEIATPTPIVAHGLIFITNGYRGVQPIYAVRPGASGDITLKAGVESSDAIAWSKQRGGPYTPTPLVYGEYLYTCSNNGVVACYQAKTGERVYQERLGKGGSFSASPLAGDGKLYFPSEDGEIFVVKAGRQYELLATNPMGEVLMATPALSEGLLVVRGMRHLFAVAAPNSPSTTSPQPGKLTERQPNAVR